MWVLAAFFYCYETFLQVSLNVMNDDLRHDFHLTATGIGILGSWYFYTYAIMQLPAGLWMDRFGVRRILTLATLICAFGCLLFAASKTLTLAAIGRLLIGFGSAFAALSCMKIAASWLPPKRFALLTGCMLTIGMVGAICAQIPLHWMVECFGWRSSTSAFGYFGIALSLIILLIVRDKAKPDNHIHSNIWTQLKYTIHCQQSWLIALYGGLVFWTTPIFGGMWGTAFLMRAHGISEENATQMIQFLFIGWALGAPVFGWLSDYIRRRRLPMLIASVGSLIMLLGILFLRSIPNPVIYCMIFLLGFFISAFLPAFSLLHDISDPKNLGGHIGFANAINMAGPAFINPLIGIVLSASWAGTFGAHQLRIYTDHAYQMALVVLPICMIISLFLLPFIKESYCRTRHDQ